MEAKGQRLNMRLPEQFNCRRCGACCRIKDGIVRVSDGEIKRIAEFLGMGEAEFIAKGTELSPDRRSLVLKNAPDGACAYLTPDSLCRINQVKPGKCRTFPFEWTNPDSANVCPELAAGLPRTSDQPFDPKRHADDKP